MAQYQSSYYQNRYGSRSSYRRYTPPRPRVDYAAIARAQRAAAQAAQARAARARAAAARAAAARAAVVRAQQARARAAAARRAQIAREQAAARARAAAARRAQIAREQAAARARAEAARRAQQARERAAAQARVEAARRAQQARERAAAQARIDAARRAAAARAEAARRERARLAAIEASKRTYYRDADGDGYGNPRVSIRSTYKPSGYVTNNSDCNDRDRSLNPNTLWYSDNDGDGYGSASSSSAPKTRTRREGVFRPTDAYYTADARYRGCNPPGGRYVRNNLDVDDNDRSVTTVRLTTYYRDGDGDGYGSRSSRRAASRPSGYVTNSSDPDDNNRYITPAAKRYYYPDNDGDGYGTSPGVYYSIQPPKHSSRSGDLDDNNPLVTTVRLSKFTANQAQISFTVPVSGVYNLSGKNVTISSSTSFPPAFGTVDRATPRSIRVNFIVPSGYSNTNSILSKTVYATQPAKAKPTYDTSRVRAYGSVSSEGKVTAYASGLRVAKLSPTNYPTTSTPELRIFRVYFTVPPNYSNSGESFYKTIGATQPAKVIPKTTYYRDADGDGFGDPNATIQATSMPTGYVNNKTDCDDRPGIGAKFHPNTIWYYDGDGDGYGSAYEPTNPGTPFPKFDQYDTRYDQHDTRYDQRNTRYDPYDRGVNRYDREYYMPPRTCRSCTPPDKYVLNNDDLDDGNKNITTRYLSAFSASQARINFKVNADGSYTLSGQNVSISPHNLQQNHVQYWCPLVFPLAIAIPTAPYPKPYMQHSQRLPLQ